MVKFVRYFLVFKQFFTEYLTIRIYFHPNLTKFGYV